MLLIIHQFINEVGLALMSKGAICVDMPMGGFILKSEIQPFVLLALPATDLAITRK